MSKIIHRRMAFLGLFVLLAGWAGLARLTQATTSATISRVSVSSNGQQANGESMVPDMSADGRTIVFASYASNLTNDDNDEAADVFLHDRQTGQTRRISVFPAAVDPLLAAGGPRISADGRFVTFWVSRIARRPAALGNLWDVYVYDQVTGTTELTNVRGLGGADPERGAYWPALSGDGRFISFETVAANLTPGDSNGHIDIFVHDRHSGQTERVSVSSAGAQGNDQSTIADISGDGRTVVFVSDANTLAPNDTNRGNDIFVHDRQTDQTRRVSLGPGGQQDPFGDAYFPFISFSGRYILFESSFGQLAPGDSNGQEDIFVYDQLTGQIVRVSKPAVGDSDSGSSWGRISADDSIVTFTSSAGNLVANDHNDNYDVFVRPFPTGSLERVSLGALGVEGNGSSTNSVISADGRFVAFLSGASNLTPGDSNGVNDIFVVDRGGGPPATVTGVVRDEAGQPIVGATVRDWRGFAAQTDEQGAFRLVGLLPGVYTLSVTKPGYVFDPPSLSLAVPTATPPAFHGRYVGGETYSTLTPVILKGR